MGTSKLGEALGLLLDRVEKDMREQVPAEAAEHVLWFFGDRELGREPGGFVSRLLEAMAHADQENLHKLGNEFPAYAFCVDQAKASPDGMEWLRSKVSAARVVVDPLFNGEVR